MANPAAKVIGIVAVAGLLGTVRVVAAQTIILHVIDDAHVPRSDLVDAEKEATRIYARSGVRTMWVNGDLMSMIDDAALHLTIVILARPASASVKDHTLGAASHATHAWVYGDNVAAFATKHTLGFGVVLGKVMAHEIGHLLLPGQGHSNDGIMEAEPNMRIHSIRFTQAQGEAIRIRVAASRSQ